MLRIDTAGERRIKNIGNIAICAVFLCLVYVFALFFLAVDKKDFSDIENRELARFPTLWDGKSVNNDFYMEFDRYYSDAFPLREQFLLANRRIQTVYTAISPPGEDDGVVFIATGGGGMGNGPNIGALDFDAGPAGGDPFAAGETPDTGRMPTPGRMTTPGEASGEASDTVNIPAPGEMPDTGMDGSGEASDTGRGDSGKPGAGPLKYAGAGLPDGEGMGDNAGEDDAGSGMAGSGVTGSGTTDNGASGNGTQTGASGDDAAADNTGNAAPGVGGPTGDLESGLPGNRDGVGLPGVMPGRIPGEAMGITPNEAMGVSPTVASGEVLGAVPDAAGPPDAHGQTGAAGPQGAAGREDDYEANESTGVSIVAGQAFEVFVFSESRTIAYAATIDAIAKKCGVPAYLLIPPSGSEIFLPAKYRGVQNEQKPAFNLLSASLRNVVYIDLYDAFLRSKDDYLYFRTDHHWTADGAYLAYRAYMNALGEPPVNKSEMSRGRLDGFLGSLYRQIYKDRHSLLLEQEPDFVNYYEPLYSVEVTNYDDAAMTEGKPGAVLMPDGDLGTNLYNVFYGGDMRLMHMKSSVANGRSIVVIRDSFGHAFLPFLANNYEHVYAIEPRYFETFPLARFISDHAVDELLFLNHSILATGRYWYNWIPELEKLK